MILQMQELYGDGSDHEACIKCGFCITCLDCKNFGCGARVYDMDVSEKLTFNINHRGQK